LLQAAVAAGSAAAWPVRAQAGRVGHALLVGNTSYNPGEDNLPPALKCLRDLEARLQRFGFEVMVLHDAPIAQVQAEVAKIQRAVTARPDLPAVFYFVGHGFQSNAENFLVPAGGDLQVAPAQLSKTCISLEKEIFVGLKRPIGPAATVIMVDACRTPDRPRTSRARATTRRCRPRAATSPSPPGPASAPSRRAIPKSTPCSPRCWSKSSTPRLPTARCCSRSRLSVPRWRTGSTAFRRSCVYSAGTRRSPSSLPTSRGIRLGTAGRFRRGLGAATGPSGTAGEPELAAARALSSPEDAAARLRAYLEKAAEGDEAEIAKLRLRDLETVLRAARIARLDLDVSKISASLGPKVAEDIRRSLQGDKYAALRVAEALPRPTRGGELIERTDYGRWMIFAANLGNGIAAYRLSEYFRNVDRRDAEASRYLALARANQYTPPRQLESGR
jgi:hypothetical protein